MAVLNGYSYKTHDAYNSDPNDVYQLHLKMPTNIPFVPQVGQKVRFIGDQSNDIFLKEYVIHNVVGDKAYIGNGGIIDWLGVAHKVQTVEVFTERNITDQLFFETGVSKTIINPTDQLNSTYEGDNYIVNTFTLEEVAYLINSDAPLTATENDLLYFTTGSAIQLPYAVEDEVETPTLSIGQKLESVETTVEVPDVLEIDGWPNKLLKELFLNSQTPAESDTIKTFNYQNIDSGLSSFFVYVEDELRKVNNDDVLLYSDVYIPNTKINGLFNVGLGSEYRLGVEAGRIVNIKDVGQNTLLIIHPNYCTSVYVGRGVLRTGDDVDLVSVSLSEDVVGYHRRLKDQYGCTDIRSIVEIDGAVYFYDQYRRAIVRYTSSGLSDLGVQSQYDKAINDLYEDFDSYEVIAGYYRDLYQYHVTFIPPEGDNGFTLVYDERYKGFNRQYDLVPDGFGELGNKLLCTKGSKVYVWNRSNTREFFGNQYTPLIEFVVNKGAELEFIFTHIILNSDRSWEIELTTQDGKQTFIYDSDWIEREKNKYYSSIKRDVTNSGRYPVTSKNRFEGAVMIGQTATVKVYRNTNDPVSISEVIVGKKEKAGHLIRR